jgi:hypothetical protein
MKSNRKSVIAVIVLVVLLALVLLYVNNQTILLRLHGFDRDGTVVAYSDIDANHEMFQIIVGHSSSGDVQIGHMTRNQLGLWKMAVMNYPSEGWSQHAWTTLLQESWPPTFQVHVLYAAANAVTRIKSIDEYLPDGITAEIFQPEDSGFFWIHIYNDGEADMNGLGIYEILQSAGYVEAE